MTFRTMRRGRGKRGQFLLLLTAIMMTLVACSDKDTAATQPGADAAPFDAASSEVASSEDGGTLEEVVSVSDQIAGDLHAGQIDEKTAALYLLLAQYSPNRLPEKYNAKRLFNSPPSVVPMMTARAHLEEYGPVEKAAVQAMLAYPEEAAWMAFPSDMPMRGYTDNENIACYAQFTLGIHGPLAFNDGSPFPTEYFTIQPLKPNNVTVPRAEELRDRIAKAMATGYGGYPDFGSYLDAIYKKYRDEMKMAEPTHLAHVALNGGKIPIFVGTCDGANQAAAHAEGYIFVSVEWAFEDTTFRGSILPHEIFHIFEYGYGYSEGDLAWPYDAFAVGVEDLIVPDLRRWDGRLTNSKLVSGGLGPLSRSFKCPEEPLHSIYEQACQNRGAPPEPGRSNGDYGKFVLVKFLMRNRGLVPGGFWQQYKDKGLNPTTLIDDYDLAAFQLALMGDVQDEPPYFDAVDRAAFFNPTYPSCDFDTTDAKRYTYWLNPAVASQNKLLRVTLNDISSRTTEGLTKFDSTASPVKPGATHRLLFEVPDEASAGAEANIANMNVHLEASASSYRVSFVTYDADLGRVFKEGMINTIPNEDNNGYSFEFTATEPLPKYALLIITNFGTAPLIYKGAVNFPKACTTSCKNFYNDEIMLGGCVEQWCWRDCGTSESCQESVKKCKEKPTDYFPVQALVDMFCGKLCTGSPGLGITKPYDLTCDNKCNNLQCAALKICGGETCDPTMPAGFYRFDDWPQMECINWFAAGKIKCP